MRYAINIYLNGIYWDDQITSDKEEASELKRKLEDKNCTIWNRIKKEILNEFIDKYEIVNPECIEVTAEIESFRI